MSAAAAAAEASHYSSVYPDEVQLFNPASGCPSAANSLSLGGVKHNGHPFSQDALGIQETFTAK